MKVKLSAVIMAGFLSLNLYAADQAELNPAGGEFGFIGYTSADHESIGLIYNFGPVFAVSPSFSLYQREAAVKKYMGALEFQWHYSLSNEYSIYSGLSAAYEYDYHASLTGSGSYEYTTHDFTGKILFGARFMINTRLALFADIGAGYILEKNIYREFDTAGSMVSMSDRWEEQGQTESAHIGVIFYIIK